MPNLISVDEALAKFEGPCELHCEGTFAVFGKDILCFFERNAVQFPDPDRLVWRPPGENLEPQDDDWFPQAVRRGTHHLFLRHKKTGYESLGTMRLTGAGGYPGDVTVSFLLKEKLPLDQWVQLGGSDGWLVNVDHKDLTLKKSDSVAFEKLLAKATNRKRGHLSIGRYEGDSLQIFFNRDRAWVMYLPTPMHSGLYIEPTDDDDTEELFSCVCGIDLEFERRHTVTRDDGIKIVRHFFATGTLSDDFKWSGEVP